MEELQTNIVALSKVDINDGKELYEFLLLDNEEVLVSYKSLRDRLIMTDKRFIAINVQGVTGKKKEFLNIPFSKISMFSCESAGTFDLDAELKLWCSGVGKVEFEFVKGTNIKMILKILSERIC
ncbi:PH domain-containing protein [Haloimpatiens sp. FM7315]|uniref:PH domain-containing protein n=1 Tax=Haloimpatiens sp. FM7315 TaxID=3298609 RepID=UPI0035A2D616